MRRRASPQRHNQPLTSASPSRASLNIIPRARSKLFVQLSIFSVCLLVTAWSAGLMYFMASLNSDALHSNAASSDTNGNSLSVANSVSNNKVKIAPKTNTQRKQLRSSNQQLQNKPQYIQLQQSSTWTWPIIHIVSTRFMQGQGSLLSLGRSRLKLLEVICLPSILKQSIFEKEELESVYNHTRWGDMVTKMNTNSTMVDPLFLWVIKVDPNLDPVLLEELNAVLEPVQRYTLVVGSNTNYGIGIKPGGWRDGQSGNDLLEAFQNDRVFFPTDRQYAFDMVSRAYTARLDRVVLETRLDADDAINISYFSVLYYTALKDLVRYRISNFLSNDDEFEQTTDDRATRIQQHNQHETAKWIYWCPHRHIQWNPSTSFYDPNNDPGMLSVFESPNVCVTPGLTLGLAVGTNESDVPRYEHTHVYWEISRGNFKTGELEQQHDCGLIPTTRCAVFVEKPFVSAFRSRAMTSAGMHMMDALGKPSLDTPDYYTKISVKLWRKHIEDYFGIVPEQAKEAANFLTDIYIDTVRDNLRGQCTKGHSCKISSLEKLQQTIDILEEQHGGIDMSSLPENM